MASSRLRFTWISVVKDLRRRAQDPFALLIWLGIPLLLGGLMSLVASSGAMPRALVLLADEDDTFLTRLFARAGGGASDMPFEIERVALAAGRARMEAGDASALLVLPAGFTEALLRDEELALELVTNPAQTIAPRMVSEALEIVVEAVFYVHRLLGEELREIAAAPAGDAAFFEDARVADIAARMNQRVRALDGTLFPPVLKLSFEEAPEEQSGMSFGLLFLPGLLFLALLFIAQGMSDDLWHEKQQGTLRRALVSPMGLAPFVAGKLGAGTAVMAATALAGLVLGVVAFELTWSSLPAALAWCTFAGLSLYCLFMLLTLCASSQRAASVLSTAVLFPLMMIGGSFFPFAGMPAWMVRAGGFTPNGRAVQVLGSIVRGELELGQFGIAFLVVALPGLVSFLLAVQLLRTRFLAR